MAAFFPDLLDDFLKPAFLKRVHEKFHYGDTQSAALLAVAKEMLPLMRREAFWERGEFFIKNMNQGKDGRIYEKVVISLGYGLDKLQENYEKKDMLSESYMLETLASELLLQSYDAYDCHIRMCGNWHAAVFHFPGSEEEFPLEMLPGILKELTTKVVCSAGLCMQPKKSVVFVAELTQDEKIRCRGICAGCGSVRCPNRTAVYAGSHDEVRG